MRGLPDDRGLDRPGEVHHDIAGTANDQRRGRGDLACELGHRCSLLVAADVDGDEAGTRGAGTLAGLRDGRVIATLQGHGAADGVNVDSEVFPVTAPDDEPGLKRTFNFPTSDHARRFVDDAIVAFEYLNCVIT